MSSTHHFDLDPPLICSGSFTNHRWAGGNRCLRCGKRQPLNRRQKLINGDPQAATLHRAPVVPMLLELAVVRANRHRHRFVDYFERSPIPADAFAHHYDFADWRSV